MSFTQDRDKIEDNNEEMDVEIDDDMDMDPPSASEIQEHKSEKIVSPSKSKVPLCLSSLPTTGDPHTTIPPPKEVLSVHNTVVDALSQGLVSHPEAEVKVEMEKLKEGVTTNSDSPIILTNLLLKKRLFPSSSPQSIYPKESNLVDTNHKEFPTLATIIDPSEISQKTGIHIDWSNIDVVSEKKSRKNAQGKPSRASKQYKSAESNEGEFVEQKKRKKSVASTTPRRKKIKKIEVSESDEEKSGDSEIDITSKPEEEHIDQNVAILLTSLAGNSQPPTPRQEKKKRRPKKEPAVVEEKYTPRSSRSSRSTYSKRFTDPTDFDFYEGWTGEVALVKTPHWPWWPALVIKKEFVKRYRNWGQRPQGAKSTFTIPVFNLFDIHGIGQSWVTDPDKIRLFEAFNIPEYTEKPLAENEKLRTSRDIAEKFRRAIEAARLHLSQSKDLMVEYRPELPDELSALVPTPEELQGSTVEVKLESITTPDEAVQSVENTPMPDSTPPTEVSLTEATT